MMDRYIAFDCETGGLSDDCSLLTVYFMLLEADLTTVVGELDLKIKPNAGEAYVVTDEALSINGINLIEHSKTAITMNEASSLFYNFLMSNNPNGRAKFIPVGHNVAFDAMFLKGKLISTANWNKFISYRQLDTGTIAQMMKLTGHMDKDVMGSLGSLASYLGIPHTQAHNAKGDTITTVKVLRRMKKIMEKKDA